MYYSFTSIITYMTDKSYHLPPELARDLKHLDGLYVSFHFPEAKLPNAGVGILTLDEYDRYSVCRICVPVNPIQNGKHTFEYTIPPNLAEKRMIPAEHQPPAGRQTAAKRPYIAARFFSGEPTVEELQRQGMGMQEFQNPTLYRLEQAFVEEHKSID